MNRKARRAARSETVKIPSLLPPDLNAKALLHHLQGEHHLVAGHLDQAREAFTAALAINPQRAATHFMLGNVERIHGNDAEAVDHYLNAILAAPEMMEAHQNLCAILLRQRRYEAVIAHFDQIMALRPDYAGGYNILASAYLGLNDASRAFENVQKSLRITETQENKTFYASCLRILPTVPDNPESRAWLIRAMTEPWGRSGDFATHALDLLHKDPSTGGIIANTAKNWPAPLQADDLRGLYRPLAREPLLRAVMENVRIANIAIERFFTLCRRALLEIASDASAADTDADLLAFGCALARQCFINEYVYIDSEAERKAESALRARLVTALRAQADIPPLWLAVIAAYTPLHTCVDETMIAGRTWPAAVEGLLKQQVREPAEEQRLRETMPRVTSISDDVSMMVREQYEKNPYPRWVKAAPANTATPLDLRMRAYFPFSNYHGLKKNETVDILVAGCGTGQGIIDPAQSLKGARVLAIDLSLSSLAYAKRQTNALGIRNVEYGQADILKLGELNRDFDIVESSGVLHHLGDPIAGWRVLLSLVRPRGLMRIALYSEIARQHVLAARAFIADRGYPHTDDGIRAFRQDVLSLPDSHPVKPVTQMSDFFSTSDCRDYVFHVQEHRFTLPQIKAFLDESGLEFLGFETFNHTLMRYRAQFPDDPAGTDLDRWHAFEQANPLTFLSMYQFWVQRRT